MASEENLGDRQPYLDDLISHQPREWDSPATKIALSILLQPGIMPSMVRRNPKLLPRLTDFLIGDKPILVVGGESGMGKSLLVADLRAAHHDLTPLLPQRLRSRLSVISWDKVHKMFYEHVSIEVPYNVDPPQGETPSVARTIVSSSIEEGARYSLKYLNSRVILELPLIDQRGETIFTDLQGRAHGIQVLIMHSPACRDGILARGSRISSTSGQPQSMREIRGRLVDNILPHSSVTEQDEIIKRWWINERLARWNGILVEWDPNDDRAGYEVTLERVRNYEVRGNPGTRLRPDALTEPLGLFYRDQFDAIFRAMTPRFKRNLLHQLIAG